MQKGRIFHCSGNVIKNQLFRVGLKVPFDLVPLEYLTCMVHSKPKQFHKVREPYLNYLDPKVSAIMLKGFPERS